MSGDDQTRRALNGLLRVSEVLSASLGLDEALMRCLEVAVEVAHATEGAIYLREARLGRFRRAAARGLDEACAPPELPRSVLEREEAARLRLPLRIDGEAHGFIQLCFAGGTGPDRGVLPTLEAIARYLAVAVRNARARELTEQRARLAHRLRQFSDAALQVTDDEEMWRILLAAELEITHADRALIARFEGDRCRVVAGAGKDVDLVGTTMPASDPALARTLKSDGPVVVEDVGALDSSTMMAQVAREKGTVSIVMAPVRHRGRTLGVLFTGSGEPRRYDEAQIEATQLLALVAGEAIGRVAAQQQLAADKRRLDATIEHLPIVVAVLAPSGELLHMNAAGRAFASEWSGLSSSDWRVGMGSVKTFLPDGRPVPMEERLIVRAFRGEHPPPRELLLVSADGTRKRHVLLVAAPLPGPDGTVDAVVTGFQDVSALRELADAKDHFLRIASHELRSPLTALRATTSLLEMDPSAITDEARRAVMLERVQRQVARLTRLVEQLIDSARLNNAETALDREESDLVALCKDAVAGVAAEHRVVLDESGPVVGSWDPLRIEQVVANLTSNAARYSPPGTTITVRVRGDGTRAIVEVIDEGIGIPADQLGRLFTPFFRASNAQAQSKGGLGLGLSISNEIVRRHGGTLRVESAVGRGSTFTVELPRGQASAGTG
jgi:signal transduction histidine kinase/GAF domain-containing protein